MKLIARETIHGRQLTVEANKDDPSSRPQFAEIVAKPDEEFDTADFGLSDKDAAALIAANAAVRKTRQVVDDGPGRGPRDGKTAA